MQKVIIIVTDVDDEKHGEISIVDDMKKAERLVETLIEAGFTQERIRVFNGSELDIQVSHRPVVALSRGEGVSGKGEDAAGDSEEGDKGSDEQADSAASGAKFSSLFRSS